MRAGNKVGIGGLVFFAAGAILCYCSSEANSIAFAMFGSIWANGFIFAAIVLSVIAAFKKPNAWWMAAPAILFLWALFLLIVMHQH